MAKIVTFYGFGNAKSLYLASGRGYFARKLAGHVGKLVIPKTPFILPYRVNGQSLEILRNYHAAQRWPEVFWRFWLFTVIRAVARARGVFPPAMLWSYLDLLTNSICRIL
jgi:hypothetical protein